MSQSFDVLVAGGGIVGLSAALGMARKGHSVAVLDAGDLRADTSTPDARVFAINKASLSLLQSLDAWQHIDDARVSPYHHMHVWDGVSGAAIDFDSRAIAQPHLGSIIEESVLKKALLEQCVLEPNLHLFAQSKIDEMVQLEQSIRLCCQDKQWDGQLLMIADGANSPTRQQLQVAMHSWSYNQRAIVATVRTEKPHGATAYQVFHPDGPLAFLPLVNPQHCSIVWSTEPQRVDHLMALSDEAFNDEVTQAFAQHLGEVKLVSARHQFPLQMRHVQQYHGARWLLLGDAAHTIHPLAGLGLNIGLADVACWLACVEQAKGSTLVNNKMLGSYQRQRKHEVWQSILLMDGFKRLFGQTSEPVSTLRGIGLRLCNQLTPLKRLFIEHAAGTTRF